MLKPLKVTFTLQGLIANSPRLLHLVGRMAYQAVENAGGDWEARHNLPLESIEFDGVRIWNASAIRFYAKRPSTLMHMIRRSNAMDFALAQSKKWFVHSKKGLGKSDFDVPSKRQMVSLDSSRGEFKAYNIYLPVQEVSHAEAYCIGDHDQVVALLKKIRYIGKKTAIGCGKVVGLKVEVDDAANDRWMFRHMPEDFKNDQIEFAPAVGSVNSPYWSHKKMNIQEPVNWWE